MMMMDVCDDSCDVICDDDDDDDDDGCIVFGQNLGFPTTVR